MAQRAIVMVLEAVYEQDFLPCSFGFRPGRSTHQALQFLRTAFMRQRLRWVIDVDIEKNASIRFRTHSSETFLTNESQMVLLNSNQPCDGTGGLDSTYSFYRRMLHVI